MDGSETQAFLPLNREWKGQTEGGSDRGWRKPRATLSGNPSWPQAYSRMKSLFSLKLKIRQEVDLKTRI